MANNNTYAFSALLARMKYIGRWGLMRANSPENLAEHTAGTAILAHVLALIARDECEETMIRPDMVAVAALYHDAGEILTGDLPTPVKYKNEDLKNAYKKLELESAELLTNLLPSFLRPTMKPYLLGTMLNQRERDLLKAADRLSALTKCIEEETTGNTEFEAAKQGQLKLLAEMELPAVTYFLEHFLPCYSQSLDGLTQQLSD